MLAGTAALVTGASSGIGAATARALAAQGAAVALVARRAERLQQVKTDIESAGGTALTVAADVTNADEVAAAVQLVVDELGRLDTVVNNAGLMRMAPAAEAPLQDWDDLVRVNVQGVLYVTRAAVPHAVSPTWSPSVPPPVGWPARTPPFIR
jgi:NADP-dependent 3-hydroxy acid dehydrogenase YdfG